MTRGAFPPRASLSIYIFAVPGGQFPAALASGDGNS